MSWRFCDLTSTENELIFVQIKTKCHEIGSDVRNGVRILCGTRVQRMEPIWMQY